jgi:hypothetical protein
MAARHTDRISLKAAADLSAAAKQHTFVVVSGNKGCNTAGAGGDAVGVQLGKAASGQALEVGVGPIVPIRLAASLSAGAEVMSNAAGSAVAWTTSNRSLGYLLEGGASGDTVTMLFAPNGRKA